jgi:hypothetical protein
VRRAFLKSEPVPDFATHSSLVFGEFSARLPWNTSPLAFAADFITLHADEYSKHPVSYRPFALMLVIGAGLRVVA